MRLDWKAFGLAAGIAAMVLFVICWIAVALVPGFTVAVGSFLFHTDLSGFTRSLSWANFIGGLIGWGVGTALVFSLIAELYNRLGTAHR
jgi:hypothetical protein